MLFSQIAWKGWVAVLVLISISGSAFVIYNYFFPLKKPEEPLEKE